jgi:hypothetical protein
VPVHFVLLMPSLKETLRRVAPRDGARRMMEEQHRALYAQFDRYGTFAGIAIDNTDLSPDQTADRVMDACGAGECLVLPALART